MNNLEWQNNIGMIAENEVVKNGVEVGVNLVIALRDSDYDNYKKLGFGWLLEEHKEPIKLKQWEYDILKTIDNRSGCLHIHIEDTLVKDLIENGYFKEIKDTSMKVKYVLDNCIIVSDDYEGFEDCK